MTASASNLPNGRKVYLDANGTPLAGALLNLWVPGTVVPKLAWLDDAKDIPAQNPITLDSAGSCTVYGVGEYREYLTDVHGNVISDQVVVASSPLVIADAMLPVLQAATPADAEALLRGALPAGSTTHLAINPGDQTLVVTPTANPAPTLVSLNVQGAAVSTSEREFLVNIGLTSGVGSGGAPANDKVALYVGAVGNAGTADLWGINPCTTENPNSGSYNHQTIELDHNNLNANRGNSGTLLTDFTAPISQGLSISGASSFTSTCGMVVEGVGTATNPQWARGMTTLGTMAVCAYQDWTTAPVGIQFDGGYSIAAINLTSLYNNVGAVTNTALFAKNGMFLTWQNSTKAAVISDYVDSGNNRVVGLGSGAGVTSGIIMGGTTIPQTSNLFGLGTENNRWADAYVTNLRLPNTSVISWNNAANNALIFDYVDGLNNRIIGGGPTNSIFMGSAGLSSVSPTVAAPLGPSLGTPINNWGNIYFNGTFNPSDPLLKLDMQPMTGALKLVEAIHPISFRWIDDRDGGKLHFGFNADDIHREMPIDFAGYQEEGQKMIDRMELIGVLWAAVRELTDRVKQLEAK